MAQFDGIPGGDLIANQFVKKSAHDGLIEYKRDMEKKIKIIESVYERNDGVYDRNTLMYCLNTLKRDKINVEDSDE